MAQMARSSPTCVLFLALAAGALAACATEPATRPADPGEFLALGIRGASAPLDGVYCSGQPSEEQFEQLAEAGVEKVISLRAPTEDGTGWEEATARRIGLDFVRIPVEGADGIDVENARRLAAEMESSGRPILVACGSSNRAGALLAMKAYHVDGKSAEDAMRIGADCGMKSLAPDVKQKLRSLN